MLFFSAEDHGRVANREITLTWRLWKYPHVKAGAIYGTGFGFVEIEDVSQVRVSDVSDADAHEAGERDAAALVELARRHTGASVTAETVLFRVRFRYLGETDPRPPRLSLSLEQVTERLNRLDNAGRGPWTLQVLRLIEENPRVVARRLAYRIGWEPVDFKAHVRKLKGLGLTISYDVGYELSELGQEFVDSRAESDD